MTEAMKIDSDPIFYTEYQLLIESYTKAQSVVKNNEGLDSQRK